MVGVFRDGGRSKVDVGEGDWLLRGLDEEVGRYRRGD